MRVLEADAARRSRRGPGRLLREVDGRSDARARRGSGWARACGRGRWHAGPARQGKRGACDARSERRWRVGQVCQRRGEGRASAGGMGRLGLLRERGCGAGRVGAGLGRANWAAGKVGRGRGLDWAEVGLGFAGFGFGFSRFGFGSYSFLFLLFYF